MDTVIYLRVSTKEQATKDETGEGYSIPAQREACIRYVAERGWNVAEEFTDAGESARTADRPMLKAMLRRVAEGEIGAIVVHKIDRLARSMEDHVAIRAALRRSGVQLVSVTENIEETASGRLVEGIHALMAEFYSANLASEIRKGMTQKAKMGGWPTKAPIGYLNIRDKTAGKEIAKVILDPERASLVREAFRLYSTGEYSILELQATMHAKGLTSPHARRAGAPMSASKLAEMLANPFYAGVVEWGGVQYEGQHNLLVPRSLFDRVQDVLRAHDRVGVRQRRHDHYLKGCCSAGSAEGASRSPGPKAHICTSTASGSEGRLAPDADSRTSWLETPKHSSRTCTGGCSFPPPGSNSSPLSWKRRSLIGRPRPRRAERRSPRSSPRSPTNVRSCSRPSTRTPSRSSC